jgi:prevent-host-death family protein
MRRAYGIEEAQRQLPALIAKVEAGGVAAITRDGRAVAYVIAAAHLPSLVETAEVLADPAAMAAIAEAEAGRGPVYTLEDIPE